MREDISSCYSSTWKTVCSKRKVEGQRCISLCLTQPHKMLVILTLSLAPHIYSNGTTKCLCSFKSASFYTYVYCKALRCAPNLMNTDKGQELKKKETVFFFFFLESLDLELLLDWHNDTHHHPEEKNILTDSRVSEQTCCSEVSTSRH